MKMTQKFANQLMDCLAILAICATKDQPVTKEEIEEYARDKFLCLCDEWSDVIEEEWEVIPEKNILTIFKK